MTRLTPIAFFKAAKDEGLTRDEAALAWEDYSAGADAPDAAPAVEAPDAARQPVRPGTIASLVAPELVDKTAATPGTHPLAAAMFPRATRDGASIPQAFIGGLADASSLPMRAISTALSTSPENNPYGNEADRQAYLAKLGDTKGKGFVDETLRDPTLLPSFAVGGPLIKGAAKLGITGTKALLATGAAEGLASATGHQADRFSRGAGVDAGEFATEAAVGAVLPAGLTGATKALKVPGKVLGALGRAGEDAVPEVLGTGRTVLAKPKFRIQLTPSQTARANGDPSSAMAALENFAETQPFLQSIPEEIASKNATAAQDAILATRNRGTGRTIASAEDIVPSVSGARLEESVRNAKDAIGKRAGRQQDLALQISGANVTPVPSGKAARAVDDYLASYGYSKTKGFRGQEGGVSEGAINFAIEQKDLLTNAKTTAQLLDQKRRIANQVYKGTSGMDPVFIGADKSFLKGLERKVNDVITEQFDVALVQNQLTNGEYMDAKKLWEAGNRGYSESRKLLEAVDKGLGLSNVKATAENYFNRVSEIGAEDLMKLASAAGGKKSDLAPVYREMRETFFDNLLKSSFAKGPNNTLIVSPDKLATKWNSMDAGIKRAMVPKSVIDEMDALLGQIAQAEAGTTKRINPSGSARLSTVINTIKNPVDWTFGLLMRPYIKEYYTTGALEHLPSAVNILRNTSKGARIAGKGLETSAGVLGGTLNNPLGRLEIRRGTRDEDEGRPANFR